MHFTSRSLLALVLLSHILLAVLYSWTTPLWGYFDETRHYAQARYIAVNKRLPTMLMPGQHGSAPAQPPAYYILAALPIMLIDVSDNLQPRFTAGGPTPIVPNRVADDFPYQGTALALRLARLISTVLGTMAICFTYAAIRIALPRQSHIALMAAAIHAWWPQFIISSASVNNDVAITLWGAFILWLVMRVQKNTSFKARCIGFVILAVCSLVSLVIKGSGASLILFSVVFVLLHTIYIEQTVPPLARQRFIQPWVNAVPLSLFFCVWLMLAGGAWIFARTTVEGIFARFFFDMATGAAVYSINRNTLDLLILQLQTGAWLSFKNWTATFKSLFAVFGWGSLELPDLWYRGALFAAALPIIGTAKAVTVKKYRPVWLIALLMFGLNVLVGQLWLSRFSLVQPVILTSIPGRYLLPTLSSIVFLIAFSIAQLSKYARGFVLLTIVMTAIATPFILFIPAYQPYPVHNINNSALHKSPDVQLSPPVIFGNIIQLKGYSLPDFQPETTCTTITLYWQAIAKPDADYALSLQILDTRLPDTSFIRTPGKGNFPTGDWHPGDAFAETYCVPRRNSALHNVILQVSWSLVPVLQPDSKAACGQIDICRTEVLLRNKVDANKNIYK